MTKTKTRRDHRTAKVTVCVDPRVIEAFSDRIPRGEIDPIAIHAKKKIAVVGIPRMPKTTTTTKTRRDPGAATANVAYPADVVKLVDPRVTVTNAGTSSDTIRNGRMIDPMAKMIRLLFPIVVVRRMMPIV